MIRMAQCDGCETPNPATGEDGLCDYHRQWVIDNPYIEPEV
jgi:hypothetical protein